MDNDSDLYKYSSDANTNRGDNMNYQSITEV